MAQKLREGRNDNRGGYKRKTTTKNYTLRIRIDKILKPEIREFIKELHEKFKTNANAGTNNETINTQE